ncbi:MAG: ABC transporter substrate-binding protein [Anaerolineae bacterium]|jgi:branched-chain amino acid transport system substrate-binding protein|nr:ABC transporter substrate-binding protein [Anaerolineae bacterium]MBT7069558.1 ABC transporter substrate-binding protein [Anaerolineae bacterium]MBT7325858.1 ABC transporter substrate-binding protein [Anaerolineae bacterium]
MSRKTMYALFAALVVAAMVLTACGGGGGDADTSIKVGAIHDLTGPTSDVGTPYAEGIKGYVAWRNANGGIEGRQVELISADYAYKVDQAELLYTQYVQEGVVVFQGWGTGDTEALRGKIAADKIPFMSASYSAGLLDMEAAPYNFLVGTSYSDQAIIAIRWAMDDWAAAGNEGMPSVVLTHHDSPFGQSPVEDAAAFAEANGVAFISLPMPGGVTDYVAELAQMQQFGANYVIVHTVSSPAAVMVKDAASQGMTDSVAFVCMNWCADEGFIELAGDAAEGVIGTIPFAPPSVPVDGHADADAWLKEQGSSLSEASLHYTQGWWTMALMAEGIEIVLKNGDELTGENIKAALETVQNFDTGGVTSPLSFSATSHRGNTSLRLYEVQGGSWAAISDYISAE